MLDSKLDRYLIDTFGLTDSNGYKKNKITEGFSGAEVYTLEIIRPKRARYRGVYILKMIDTQGKWYKADNNELHKSQKIYSEAVSYQKHLVEVEKNVIIENKLVLILSYAFKSALSTISLSQIRLDNKINLLRQISYDLLSKLNAGNIEYTDNCDIVSQLCTYRISEDGNFVKRIKEYVREWNKTAININGLIFPNPYIYVKKLNEILCNLPVQYIKGVVHGDLHQKNILTTKDGEDYVIIDYDSCTTNYLLFDQAYLELNCYINTFHEWNLEQWVEGLNYVFMLKNDVMDSVEFAGVIGIEKSIREGITKWYDEKCPNLMDSFQLQILLARIAAGINFFSKSDISDTVEHIKYLVYIGFGLKKLFELIDYKWDESNCSRLVDKENDLSYAKKLWDECGKFRNEYIKILITDDMYDKDQYKKLLTIAEIDWRLIVDVGNNMPSKDFVFALTSSLKEFNGVKFIEKDEKVCLPETGNTSFLQIKKGEETSKFEHWKTFKNNFIHTLRAIYRNEPLKSILFILDLHSDACLIRNRFVEMLWEENLIRKGSRFVCLGLNHDLPLSEDEMGVNNLKYFEHKDMNLLDVIRVVDEYGIRRKRTTQDIKLPCIDSLEGQLSKEVWNDYSSMVEIVYSGMENNVNEYTNGEDFYKGNEISWLDLAQKKDIEWKEYEKWKKIILRKLQTERVVECRLIHGAGAGGTTLSKRLMWDVKDVYPTVRLRKYTAVTADVISDIYRKTGKSVFVVLEMGSTIISDDELVFLKKRVNSQSCRALFLKVERTASKEEEDKAEIYLSEDLIEDDARNFFEIYSAMTSDEMRKKNLSSITYDYIQDEWRGQCCPFFYGFYTFQEEYQGVGRFLRTSVANCRDDIKKILTDLSIITKYSQNVCMPYEEMAQRLNLCDVNLVEIFSKFNEGIEKILVQKEKGFRICHPLIAKKLIELIYNEYKGYNDQLYSATIDFIDRMSDIYDETDREYIDIIFKELFIDRSYIDGEQQKFSLLINDLEKQTSKIDIFEKLINIYKDNPHYYNHLGRLQIYEERNMQFDKAVANLKKALIIAEEDKLTKTPHLTTLGCIYSKKVIYDMAGSNKTADKLLDTINVDFGNANSCFLQARRTNERSTYAYFPNILMICNIVKRMTKVTGMNLDKLLKNNLFEKWYNYYSGIAIQLFEQMKRNCDEELSEELQTKAERNILFLLERVSVLKSKLHEYRKKGSGIRECSNLGRTISMLLYMQNEFKWEGMDNDELQFVEKELDQILKSGDYNQNDIIVWFSVYRQMNSFEIDRAKRYVVDYMEETYYKNYILWILSFEEYIKGVLSYRQVEEYLNGCRYSKQIADENIRTTRNIDAYSMTSSGFPIKRFGSLKNEEGEYENLKCFKGIIINIEGTVKGKIQMVDFPEVILTFTPSYTVGDEKREFTREDILVSPVEFKLIFTYSGYKAWDVKKIE